MGGEAARTISGIMIPSSLVQVLSTTELLEQVLQFLDPITFFRAHHVSRQWFALCRQMVATNALIRKKLFLIPATLDEMLEPHSPLHPDTHTYLQHPRPKSKYPAKLSDNFSLLNPFLSRCIENKLYAGDLLLETFAKNDLRSRMLLTQPPLETVTWSTTFGDQVGIGTGEHGYHEAGAYLWIKTNAGNRSAWKLMEILEMKVRHFWGCKVFWKASGIRIEGEMVGRSWLEDVRGGVEMGEQVWRVLESDWGAAAGGQWESVELRT